MTVTVGAVNDAPNAHSDSYDTGEDEELEVDAPGLLGNDSDPDGDRLTASLAAGPDRGSLTLNPDGSFTYTPQDNFHGNDSFTYAACDDADPRASSEPAEVRIAVRSVDDDSAPPPPPPTLSIGNASVTEGDSGTRDASLTVSMSRPGASEVRVKFETADGSARAPGDYSRSLGGLTFQPGQTRRVGRVPVRGDNRDEPDESFLVRLFDGQGATIGVGRGRATIRDDDEPTRPRRPAGPAEPCESQRITVRGRSGHDHLIGTQGPDVIFGGSGDDTIDARGGNDVVCGQSGNDRISGGHGNDRLDGASGDDRVAGGEGSDRLQGFTGEDRLFG